MLKISLQNSLQSLKVYFWYGVKGVMMKIKLNSDDDLALKRTLKFCNMIIVVRSLLHESGKYYP